MTNPDHARFKASPIYAAMQKVAPDYWPDDLQGYAMLASPNPQKDAGFIPSRVAAVKHSVGQVLGGKGFTADDVRTEEALVALRRFEGLPEDAGRHEWRVEQLGINVLIDIVFRKAASDPVRLLYLYLFGREPDGPGYGFYTKLLAQGVPLSVIIDDMEVNKANGAV